jgi:hypothetical protein
VAATNPGLLAVLIKEVGFELSSFPFTIRTFFVRQYNSKEKSVAGVCFLLSDMCGLQKRGKTSLVRG